MGKVKMEPMKRSLPMKKPKAVKARSPAASAKRGGKKRSGGGSGGGKSGGKDGILTALAELKAVGMHSPSRTLVAHMAKYNGAEQAGFKKTLSQLSQAGLVEYGSNSTLEITARGEAQVSAALDPPTTNADIHVRIKAMLPPKAACIFDVLADGRAHTRLEIAHATGYPNDKTAGFKKMLSSVGGLGFLEYPSSTTAQLKDSAFPFGRDGSASTKKGPAKNSAGKSLKKEAPDAKPAAKATSPPTLPNNVSAGDEDEGYDETYEAAMEEEGEDEHEPEEDGNDEEENDDDDEEDQNDSESEWDG